MSTDTNADTRTWYRPGYTVMWNQIRRLTPITDRQHEVLRFVVEYIGHHGYAPTVREVGAHFGWRSTRTAGEHLHDLARKGALEITPGIARGVRVLGHVASKMEADRAREASGTAWAHGRVVKK